MTATGSPHDPPTDQPHRARPTVRALLPSRPGDIARPDLARHVTELLVNGPDPASGLVRRAARGGQQPVAGTTVVLAGASGSGKSTLARMLIHDPVVQGHFPDGIVWVALGNLTPAELADRFDDVCKAATGTKPAFLDPAEAGDLLADALYARQVLLVLDDAVDRLQVEPFLAGGPTTARLVTTRRHDLLPIGDRTVAVDAMTHDEGAQLLTAGLPDPPHDAVEDLLGRTGRSPLLLGLVNAAARDDARAGATPGLALPRIRDQLLDAGAFTTDGTDGTDGTGRDRAVDAVLEVILGRLSEHERPRCRALGILATDVEVPLRALARFWALPGDGPADLEPARALCRRLADLALIDLRHLDSPDVVISVRGVVREHLRRRAAADLSRWNARFVDAQRGLAGAWGRLAPTQTYLWHRLPAHLHAAGLHDELVETLTSPEWLVGKLTQAGPAALAADLSLAPEDATCRSLGEILARTSSLLAPLEPAGSLAATFADCVPDSGPTAGVADAVTTTISGTYLRRWPGSVAAGPEGTGHDAGTRGHTDDVSALAAAPDGSWFATGGGRHDGTVRIWDPLSGRESHILPGHSGGVCVLAVAPDGTWLASGGEQDGAVRIWDPVTGRERHTLRGHTGCVSAVAVGPDGTWLATGGDHRDRTLRIWDPVTGRERHTLHGHPEGIYGIVAAPDGSWLATSGGDGDGEILIWDPVTGSERHTLSASWYGVALTGVAPDGSWLAAVDDDMVRSWDPASGEVIAAVPMDLEGIGTAVAPDGSWLALGGTDGSVHLWEPGTGRVRRSLTGHTERVRSAAVAADGSWLATVDSQVLRLWDPATGTGQAALRLDASSSPLVAVPGTSLVAIGVRGCLCLFAFEKGTG